MKGNKAHQRQNKLKARESPENILVPASTDFKF